jgi:hypothetical protein
MRHPTTAPLPLAGAIALAAGAVVVAALATPAQFERLQTGCGDQLCADSLERPSDALLAQLDSLGVSAIGWAVSVLVLEWVLLIAFCLLGSSSCGAGPPCWPL